MNVLKKLQLTLLATSVIFFPKAGHAADQENDERSVMPARPLPVSASSSSQEPEELRSVQFMTSSDATLLRTIVDSDNAMCDFYSSVNEETMAKMRSVSEGISSEEFQARAEAIKRNFATSVFSTNYPPEEARSHFLDVFNVSTRALELPVLEIDARGAAINKMVESLFTFMPDNWDLLKAKGLVNPKGSSLNQFRLTDSEDLIDFALSLPSQEILDRADRLKKNEEVLLTNSYYSRPKVIKSLFKLEPGEIERRVTIMPSLIQYVRGVYHIYNIMGANMELNGLISDVAEVKIDDLERNAQLVVERIDPFITMAAPGPNTILSQLMREILKANPDDNESRFDTIERSWGALSTVIPPEDRSSVIVNVFKLKLSSDEVTNRTTALIQNQEHLREDRRATIFIEKNADEIIAIAERNAETRRRKDEINQAQMRVMQSQFCSARLRMTLSNLKRTSPHLLFTQLDERNEQRLLEKAENLVLAQQYKADDLTVFEKAYSDLFPSDEK
ncbi:MAG: hypothetical protein K2Y08_02730 [Alphaproteobacteria bacterium]|nr:hypothetical protein [Alphaproteobacteria bacterium]